MTYSIRVPDLGDPALEEAYRMAAERNVLAAVNNDIFDGYWSVCADGEGFGRGCTYPSLDGHQMSDALLFLGRSDTVLANWEYVRGFQRPDGTLPIAILPHLAGQEIGVPPAMSRVDDSGALYRHWVPGGPLRALAAPTYIQNADVIYRRTRERGWLAHNIASVNSAAGELAGLMNDEGLVGGAGYYVERPARIEYDGVSQCHAYDAFRRLAWLNDEAGDVLAATHYRLLAARIRAAFQEHFWLGDRSVEYIHPERGAIATHGLTDVDWSAIATGILDDDALAVLWPRLRDANGFRYGGMPTGIAAEPDAYEDWEFSHPDRHDLAAMGRVWYLECWARWRMGDREGIVDTLHRVADIGRANGYSWRERYYPDGTPAGAEHYNEYPANLIRIVHRFLLDEGGALPAG